MYQYQQFAILLRGGGDIATGIALRLYRSGFRRLIILETAHPMAVRRRVAFSEAVYEGLCTVEGITAAPARRNRPALGRRLHPGHGRSAGRHHPPPPPRSRH